MFYCEECRKARNWPESYSQSRGPCELCKKLTVCYDRPSSSLPNIHVPSPTIEEPMLQWKLIVTGYLQKHSELFLTIVA